VLYNSIKLLYTASIGENSFKTTAKTPIALPIKIVSQIAELLIATAVQISEVKAPITPSASDDELFTRA